MVRLVTENNNNWFVSIYSSFFFQASEEKPCWVAQPGNLYKQRFLNDMEQQPFLGCELLARIRHEHCVS